MSYFERGIIQVSITEPVVVTMSVSAIVAGRYVPTAVEFGVYTGPTPPLHLYHITVGDAAHEPTQQDLKDLLARFESGLPFCESRNVVVQEHTFFPESKIVLTMGTPEWTPSAEELQRVRDSMASLHKEGGVLITHYSAKLKAFKGPAPCVVVGDKNNPHIEKGAQ